MTPDTDTYTLQHSDVPQSTLLDEALTTRDWPMPAGGKWEPKPRRSVLDRIGEVLSAWNEPWIEI